MGGPHRTQNTNQNRTQSTTRRARVVKGIDWKPIVISRAGSSPAVDAKCRMAEGYRKGDARFDAGLEGSFSSFGETSLVVLTLRCQI